MTSEKEQMLALAERFAAGYAADPSVIAVLLIGSLSHGQVDGVSDIDLAIYYREPPEIDYYEAQQAAAIASGGGVYGFDAQEGLVCYFFVDGVKIDTAHMTAAAVLTMVDRYLADPGSAAAEAHIVMSGVRDSLPLYGAAWAAPVQARLARLTREQSAAIVRAHLRFPPRTVVWEMGVARGDYPAVYELLVPVAGRLIAIWCALNRQIPPGKIKSAARALGGLAVLPDNAATRLIALFDGSTAAAVGALDALIEETLALVEAHMPEIDTDDARRAIDRKLRLEV